jgi:hypothetical protein
VAAFISHYEASTFGQRLSFKSRMPMSGLDIHGMGYEDSVQFKQYVKKLVLEYTNTPYVKPAPWRKLDLD